MKIKLSFKTPDCLSDAIREVIENLREDEEIAIEEHEDALYHYDCLFDDAYDAASKFVKYGEYVTIEIDTDAGTAQVVPV